MCLVFAKTKTKVFEPGDFCIVLTPDDDRKLFARWSQPVPITRRISQTAYEVNLDGKRLIKPVNCLRPFTPRTIAAHVLIGDSVSQVDDASLPLVDWDWNNTAVATAGRANGGDSGSDGANATRGRSTNADVPASLSILFGVSSSIL